MPVSKEQRQVLMLSTVLAIIAGTLLWLYGDNLLPQADGLPPTMGRTELPLPTDYADPLFDRADYKALKQTQGVPVKPFEGIPRNPNPFEPLTP